MWEGGRCEWEDGSQQLALVLRGGTETKGCSEWGRAGLTGCSEWGRAGLTGCSWVRQCRPDRLQWVRQGRPDRLQWVWQGRPDRLQRGGAGLTGCSEWGRAGLTGCSEAVLIGSPAAPYPALRARPGMEEPVPGSWDALWPSGNSLPPPPPPPPPRPHQLAVRGGSRLNSLRLHVIPSPTLLYCPYFTLPLFGW